MPTTLITEKIIDPFQALITIHKKQIRSQNIADDHYKDCKFKPAILKQSQNIAEKKYKEDLEKSQVELEELQDARAKTAMQKIMHSSKNLVDKSPVRVSLLYLDGKKKA